MSLKTRKFQCGKCGREAVLISEEDVTDALEIACVHEEPKDAEKVDKKTKKKY